MQPASEFLATLSNHRSPQQALEHTDISETHKILGVGSARLTLDNGDTVIKIAIGDNAKQQNTNEIRVWNHLKQHHPKPHTLAAPIRTYAHTHKWLEMKKVTIIEDNFHENGYWANKLKPQFKKYGIQLSDIGVGQLNGNNVAFDYGMLHKITQPNHSIPVLLIHKYFISR